MLKRTKKRLLVGLMCAFGVSAVAFVASACSEEELSFQPVTVYHSDSVFLSPSGIARSGDNLFVSDATANKLYKLNDDGDVIKAYSFDSAVNGVYASEKDVYALVGGLAGEVYRFDTNLTLLGKAETEHTPTDALLSGGRLYVCNRFSNSVSVFNADLTDPKVIPLEEGREPMALTEAQGKVFVACHLPKGPANAEVVSSTLVVIDPAAEEVSKNIALQNGTGGVKDITTSSDGNYVYLSCLFERYSYPTSQLDRGWSNTNGFAIVDARSEEVYAGVLVDNVDRGAANPWGIGVVGNGTDAKIVVGISGLSEISILDETAMMKKLSDVAAEKYDFTLEEVIDHAEFSADFSERFDVGGNGLRAVLLTEEDGEQFAYTAQYFDGTISRVPLEGDETGARRVKTYKLGEQGKLTEERLGEILWHDADYFYQGWETCASCHPGAHPDGFDWDEGNDGLGNAKSTKSMLYAHRTPPNLVSGLKENGEIAVRESVQTFYEEDYLDCMDAYLRSMKPVQSPYLNRDGTLTESAQRGEQLFVEYGCNACHTAPLYTDLQPHTPSSLEADDTWEDRALDTPTLVEVWRTSPYLFNGSAKTMEDAVRQFVGTRPITDGQVKDLAEFILSIGDNGEIYGVEEVFFDKNDDDGGECAVRLVAGRTITRVTVRKQWDDERNALVTLTLCGPSGEALADPVYAVLSGMEAGDYAEFKCRVEIPSDLAKGSYYEITIVDVNDRDSALATPLRVYADNRFYSEARTADATSPVARETSQSTFELPEALPSQEKLLPEQLVKKEERS